MTLRYFWRFLPKFFLEWEMFQTKCAEKIKTHILYSITFFRKSHRLWDNVEKCGDGGATNDVTIRRIRVACWMIKATCTYAHAHAHVPGYPRARTHAQACTHRPIYNTYCFSTAIMVSWTSLSVALYVHCLSCWTTLLIQQLVVSDLVQQWVFTTHCSPDLLLLTKWLWIISAPVVHNVKLIIRNNNHF
jgi:hypothetical protein